MSQTADKAPHEMAGVSIRQMADAIRALSMDAVQKANSGHPGMPMGMADVATVLFSKFLRVDPSQPEWPNRDRFVLSNGHGSMLQYSLMHLLGFPEMTIEEIENFRQLGSRTAGHPEYGHAAGIEATTGPLGQGITMSVGMALAERMLAARFGDDLVDHYTYVFCGDGCLMEGISHEAIDLAGHLKLNKLIVFFDDNHISIDGDTKLATSIDQRERFEAHGWNTFAVDGHDPDAVEKVIAEARKSDKPAFIACRTIIGYGAPNLQGTDKVHGNALGKDEVAATRKNIGWTSEPFVIPQEIYDAWHAAAKLGREARKAWEKTRDAAPKKAEFEAQYATTLPENLAELMAKARADIVSEQPKVATRKASEMALEVINGASELTIGGSADLTPSNNTKTKGLTDIAPGDYSGRYVRYGVREHGMAATMNGIALHGGFIPYGGTFMCFTDYARGAIRLSALMGIRVVYVMTHDSIGLGEDGPTHQPVEHLAIHRATPNLLLFRPADAVETNEAWEIAMAETKRPSVMALSRQGVPTVRSGEVTENRTRKGAYVLKDVDGTRDLTILSTGTEVEIALKAAETLESQGRKVAVVSMPCWELFEEQDEAYRKSVLGSAPRIAIEAAVRLGWDRWLGEDGRFIGMHSFGASAPGPEVYKHFGITAEAVVTAAGEMLKH
ncbi:transketolase [Aurantimonas sp. VKM B-3413]|uniref:transketolase n=1 Tax=Aurantimonas sp. VKM B-3413 TaxID=2779401 RepID=UPI001E2E0A40|nr:transketolase [Aurantimonas sp. VKM B-3413]MCB8838739.1 transketolase [Aurantimonas sp. VKM B-3413]